MESGNIESALQDFGTKRHTGTAKRLYLPQPQYCSLDSDISKGLRAMNNRTSHICPNCQPAVILEARAFCAEGPMYLSVELIQLLWAFLLVHPETRAFC